MSHPFDDEEIREYRRMEKEAYGEHDPELEPYASMPAEQLMELWEEAQRIDDVARVLMLEQFVHDKLNPRAFLAVKMSKRLAEWFLLEYGDEYAEAIRKGAHGRAAAEFAMTVIDANDKDGGPGQNPGPPS